MALTINGVSDTRFYLGPGLAGKIIEGVPASADYVQGGGYTITAEQCEFGNGHLFGGVIVNQEYSSSNAPVYMINLPSGSYGTSPQPSTTQLNVSAWWSGAQGALLEEVATGTDLSSYPFWLLVLGY